MWRSKLSLIYTTATDRLLATPPMATIRIFKMVVYGLLLLNAVFLLPVADLLWGDHALIMPLKYPETPLYRLFFFLMEERFRSGYLIVITVQILAILSWYFLYRSWIVRLIIYLSTIVLFTSAHLYTTGGHTFFGLLLFYLVFIPDQPASDIQRILANLFLLVCKIQLMIVYLFAGLFKLHSNYWLNGEALYYVLNLREFSHPFLQKWLLDFPLLLKAGTWIALGYQLLFPVLVWIHAIKKPFLVMGAGFHLMVAFGMGLPDFGLFMIGSYTMFFSNRFSQQLLDIPGKTAQLFQRSWKSG